MKILMLISIVASTIMGTIVGLKLLLLAKRTRQFPEFAIGMALFSYAAIAQTSLLAAQAVSGRTTDELQLWLLAIRLVGYYVTLVGLSAFTLYVFGLRSRARIALTLLVTLTAIVTMSASLWAYWIQTPTSGALPAYAHLGGSPQYAIVFAWMSIESLRYRRMLKRREALGLADPVLVNRFGIWGVSAGLCSVLLAALTVIMLRADDPLLGSSILTSAIVSGTGLVTTLGWWLTFMPPAMYTNWIRSYAALEAPNG